MSPAANNEVPVQTYTVPRKNYASASGGQLEGLLAAEGVDPAIARGLSKAFNRVFGRMAVDERLNYDYLERVLSGLTEVHESWVPQVTQGPVLGTSSIKFADFITVGQLVIASTQMTFNSNGTAGQTIRLSLPVPTLSTYVGSQIGGTGFIFDASASLYYHGNPVAATASLVEFFRPVQANAYSVLGSAGFTGALTTPDQFYANLIYIGDV
jgi:hypothetical protein